MERGILIALRSNADVIRIASGMLATGQFHFCRWDGGAFGKASPVQAIREAREGTRAARARESQQEQDHETKIRKSWIEIRLVDEKNKPVPGVAYRIQLPDGAIRSGSLDEDGSAYVGGIDPGQCQVTFPELDGRDWKRS